MQAQHDHLTIGEFEAFTDDEVREYALGHDKSDLAELLLLIKKKRAVRWEDRAILQMVEKSPLTLWASNKAYRIVLWAGTCKETYNRDLLGEQFSEIMSIYERSQAMADSISVIEANEGTLEQLLADFRNYYTKDMQGTRTEFSLVTNSMQLEDDESGERYYAEIGLPIDLEKALDVHKNRQREFDECVSTFKADVRSLKDCFAIEIKALRARINSDRSLTPTKKAELRKLIDNENANIITNLNKNEMAFDFELFLRDNEEAIDLSIQKLNYEIGNAINKVATITQPELQEDPSTFKDDIDHKMELVLTTFGGEISKKTSATINDPVLVKRRSEQINALQNKRDEILRELTEMRESVDSSTNYALVLCRKRLDAVEPEMRHFIDQTNKVEEEAKNAKKK